MICSTYPYGALPSHRFVVILSTYCGQILLSRHHARSTWETQGGHIEPGETPLEAARRELQEESGAVDFEIRPLCDYAAGVRDTGALGYGCVFTADIHRLGDIPPGSEMAEVRCFDALPENITYPAITPVLFRRLAEGFDRRVILLGTTNPSKVRYFERLLADAPVQFVTPAQLGIDGEPEENGHTPAENAAIKAAYYGQYADTVICVDSGLYFDALPLDDPRQPGLHIRTPQGGERLDDEQMIAYYARLAGKLGGRVLAYYMDGLALKTGEEIHRFVATREEARMNAFYMLDKPCERRREGWPLDSLSLDLNGVSFLEPRREVVPQLKWGYKERMKAFLLERLGL
ncbi:MAG: NUDIX domain-containing protein [Clostridia bacterium]|nr:NUDIX domain-containing protein [Clostridia bacterium]